MVVSNLGFVLSWGRRAGTLLCLSNPSANLHVHFDANHKNYNFLDCDWLKNKLLFSTNSLAKLLSDSSISQSHSKL